MAPATETAKTAQENRVNDLPAFIETLKKASVRFRNDIETGPGVGVHAAIAVARTASSVRINSSSSAEVNNPSGPRGIRSVNGDS